MAKTMKDLTLITLPKGGRRKVLYVYGKKITQNIPQGFSAKQLEYIKSKYDVVEFKEADEEVEEIQEPTAQKKQVSGADIAGDLEGNSEGGRKNRSRK